MGEAVHFVTDLLAIFIGVQLYLRSRVLDTVLPAQRMYILIGALLGALIGSRLIAALENPELFFAPSSLFYYVAGKTIIGGIAGGILGVEAAKKIFGIRAWTGDRALIPLTAAIIIGRTGCFVLGVPDGTVGGPCAYPWCLDQGDGILRHPNSLYEIAFVSLFLCAYIFLKHYTRHLRAVFTTPGASFRIFIVLYFSFRFSIEFVKETHSLVLGLNSIQWVCLLFVLWYMRDLIRALLRKRS